MDSPINSMMLRRVSMRPQSVSLSARATREVTNGPSRSHKTREDTLLVCPRALACQPRMYCTQQVAPWKKKMKPPKCISARTVTLAQVSRERVTMIGRLILALLTRLVTFRLILSVTESRSCLTERPSQSCPNVLRKPSPRQSL